ncbi:hypothetical protein ACWGI8_36070, partial [Streptomyces sp. NPDC054841]
NRSTWWRIPYGQQGVSKADLCRQWRDRALPVGHGGLTRGVVLPELRTCTQELLEQDWIDCAVADTLGHGDAAEVASALDVAQEGSRRDWLTEPQVQEATAAVIEYCAWPLTKLVCLVGAEALKRVKEEAKAQGYAFSKATRDDLKNRAPRLARERLIANGGLADKERFAALPQPGSSPYDELVESVIEALHDELEFSNAALVAAASESPSASPQATAQPPAAMARKPRALRQDEARRLLGGAEAGQRWLRMERLAGEIGLSAYLKALHREPDDMVADAITDAVKEVTVHTLRKPDWGSEEDLKETSGRLKQYGRWRLLDLLRKRGSRREEPLDDDGAAGGSV